MNETFNIYCDESCHLEHDHQPIMVLGAVSCQLAKAREIAKHIRELKEQYQLSPTFEIKWSKVSPAKINFYLDIVKYFFNSPDLRFRGLVIPDKGRLRHDAFIQDHDTWYYKMYFVLLKQILGPASRYRIYLDIKDTRGSLKIAKLHDVLCNSMYDFDKAIIERVQQVRSHEVEILQLADLITGVLAYVHRNFNTSSAKLSLVEHVRQYSGHTLRQTTLPKEAKFNLLVWDAQEW